MYNDCGLEWEDLVSWGEKDRMLGPELPEVALSVRLCMWNNWMIRNSSHRTARYYTWQCEYNVFKHITICSYMLHDSRLKIIPDFILFVFSSLLQLRSDLLKFIIFRHFMPFFIFFCFLSYSYIHVHDIYELIS